MVPLAGAQSWCFCNKRVQLCLVPAHSAAFYISTHISVSLANIERPGTHVDDFSLETLTNVSVSITVFGISEFLYENLFRKMVTLKLSKRIFLDRFSVVSIQFNHPRLSFLLLLLACPQPADGTVGSSSHQKY